MKRWVSRLVGPGDESGQSLVVVALCLTCLMGFVALAADVGTLFHAKRELQIAADAAAIAGAAEIGYTDLTTSAAGQAAATQNGVTNGTNGATVAINEPPLYGPFAGEAGYVEAIVTRPEKTTLLGLFGYGSVAVAARAVATNGSGNGCIYTLGTSGTDIGITGNASISAPGCGIVDDSDSSDALDLTGNITLDANSIGIVGGYSHAGNITVTPTPVTGIVPASNPLAYLPTPTVPPSCTNSVGLTGDHTESITQGCYSGISLVGNTSLTLASGTYIIDGTFSVTGNASITGTGVTLVLLGSTTLTGNGTVDLTAPTSGTYNGILIDQPASDTDSISLVGNTGSTLEGIIYAPGAAVSMTGNSGSTIYTDFVVRSLTLVGNASFQDYASLNGYSPITATKLVE